MTALDTDTKEELDKIAANLKNSAENSRHMARNAKVFTVSFVVFIVFLFLIFEGIIVPYQEERTRAQRERLRSEYIGKLEDQKKEATLALDKLRASREDKEKISEQAKANRQDTNAEYEKSLVIYKQTSEKFQPLEADYLAAQEFFNRAREDFALAKEKLEAAPKVLQEAVLAQKELEIKAHEASQVFRHADDRQAEAAVRLEEATQILIHARARLKARELGLAQADQRYHQVAEALRRAGEVLNEARNEQTADNATSEKDEAYQHALKTFIKSKKTREQARMAVQVQLQEHSRALEVRDAAKEEYKQAVGVGYQTALLALRQIEAEYRLAKTNVEQASEAIEQSTTARAEASFRSQQAEKALNQQKAIYEEAEAEYSTFSEAHEEVIAADHRAQSTAEEALAIFGSARDAEERQKILVSNATLAYDDALKVVPIQKANAQLTVNVWEIVQNLALRVGSVVLVVYLVQILVSYSRYHYQINDCLSGQAHALQIAVREGDLSKLEYFVAALSTDKIRFGKMPAAPSDKMIDTVKEAIGEAMNRVKT